ncbi:hypothetical protein [Methylorubrum salsuginis]|uniref:Anti-sigma factor NepR domain-containing protein n=1 Tax=Methylorubrum salsuginis TaxID=414703 RepID=A0A1I4CIS2_9HYPH|nr:hypothetical protein [Methylorubrum salsuginis]SFK80179.1 hypothetical protein SAMN04488125_104201 [Methylorubrum salsuginis]
MTKTVTETKSTAGDAVPPLSQGVRRHLGKNLRSLYAGCLTEPVGERIEALIARLGKTRG